ncbi:MAG: hypothetical protein H6718_21115 [Polyangiaceae bacterium]|nr:hypothetical protein [Polyangiaceae bacterium]
MESVAEPLSLPGQDPPNVCKKKKRKKRAAAEDQPSATPKKAKRKRKHLWLVIGLSQELSLLGGDDVCTAAGQDDGFYCFREDGSQYSGNPVKGRYDSISSGFALSATRLFAGLDYVVGKATVGARLGYTVRGSSPTPVGGGDFPFLIAARAEYWFAKHAYRTSRLGFYLLGEAGAAEADSKREKVPVEEDRSMPSNQVNPDQQYMEVWKRAGRAFVGLGAGLLVPAGKTGGVVIELPLRAYVPASGFTVAPTLGYAAGF